MNPRQKAIIEILRTHNKMSVHDLAETFEVSDETIRRDLKYLESRKLLVRLHGEAMINSAHIRELEYQARSGENHYLKYEAGQLAKDLIHDGDSIAISNGTSTYEIAKAITEKQNLTVITNSILIAGELLENDSNQIIVIGGKLRKQGMGTSGSISSKFLSNFRVDYGIISVGGISLEQGVTDFTLEEAMLFRTILSIAKKKIVVADSTKFGKSGLCKVCEVEEIDILLSDSELSSGLIKQYREIGIDVIVPT